MQLVMTFCLRLLHSITSYNICHNIYLLKSQTTPQQVFIKKNFLLVLDSKTQRTEKGKYFSCSLGLPKKSTQNFQGFSSLQVSVPFLSLNAIKKRLLATIVEAMVSIILTRFFWGGGAEICSDPDMPTFSSRIQMLTVSLCALGKLSSAC